MGTVLASAIVARARPILQDDDSTQYLWSDATLLDYLNDGQRNIVFLKPNAYVLNASVQLAEGTKQDVTGGIGLIKITRMMGSDGTTPGTPISFVLLEQVNYITSSFHTAEACATPDFYTYDPQDPAHFYVYPPQPATSMGWVEEIYTGLPADVALGAAITLNDIYQTALLNYILYRAYSRETDSDSGASSVKYYNLYLNELGIKAKVEGTQKG